MKEKSIDEILIELGLVDIEELERRINPSSGETVLPL